MELNEKVIAEKVEAKINELYINKVLGETTIIVIQALSSGYRDWETLGNTWLIVTGKLGGQILENRTKNCIYHFRVINNSL